MTNIFKTPEKRERRNRLFEIAVEALQEQGWTVERIPRIGKSSVRRIRRGDDSRTVSIRTTQNGNIAFPRDRKDRKWVTLSEVDDVVAASVDDAANPKFALIHLLDGNDLRKRFDRSYAARMAAGHSIPVGRGVWLPLYVRESKDSPGYVGAGAGIESPPIARVPLKPEDLADAPESLADDGQPAAEAGRARDEEPLTIAEAKRRLALTFGVDPSSIKIIVEG